MSETRALSVVAVAERLGVSPWTVRNRIADGPLPAVRFGGRVLVPEWALTRLLGSPPDPSGEEASDGA